MKIWLTILSLAVCGQTIPPEKERALGRGLADHIRRQSGSFANADVTAYVERVGARLAAAVPGVEFRFEVVGPGALEPMGLPGGTVLVPSTFFRLANDEAEFAGMLAHAMGHVVLRHGVVNASPAAEGAIPLVFLGGWASVHADSRQTGALVPAGFLENIRRFELEADQYGADVAARAGYDATGLRGYLQRVQPEEPAPAHSPLPAKAKRLAALKEGRGEVGGSEYLRIRDLVTGTRARR